MGERLENYNDWNQVVKACESEFEKIDNTRITMKVAEECQKVVYKNALKRRSEYPEPIEMEEENKPKEDESSESTESKE